MNDYKEASLIFPKENNVFTEEIRNHFVTVEMRDEICKDALILDDDRFEKYISDIKSFASIEDCFFSEELLHLRFAIRAFKYLWKDLSLESDWDSVLESIIKITNEWIDTDDFEFQKYLLDARDILRDHFVIDMCECDI